jgi:CspA family cold shock protein
MSNNLFIGHTTMLTGSIISFKEDRGYGFISSKDSNENVYLHISTLQASGIDKVEIGQRLTYELLSEDGRISATNIKLLD